MASRGKLMVLAGVAVASCHGYMATLGCFTPSLTSPLRNSRLGGGLSDGLPSEVPRAPASDGSSSWLGASGLLAAALVGVASSAGLRTRRRQVRDVSMNVRRFRHVYGDEGEKVADWINPESEKYGNWGKNKLDMPPWLSMAKIRSLPANYQNRHPTYYKRFFDESGNPAFDPKSTYTLNQAIDLLISFQERAPLKANRTVDLSMAMGLDQKFPDQQIRTSVKMPNGSGKEQRVAVFCGPEDEQEALDNGACAAGDVLAQDIEAGKIDFDVLIAKPQMMPRLARLGRVLGPLRLMPSPKSGTVVQDIKTAIQDFKMGGALEVRTCQRSTMRLAVGQLSMGKQKITENIRALWDQMVEKKPVGATKANYWKRVTIKSSKSPSILISLADLPQVEEDEAVDSDDE